MDGGRIADDGVDRRVTEPSREDVDCRLFRIAEVGIGITEVSIGIVGGSARG